MMSENWKYLARQLGIIALVLVVAFIIFCLGLVIGYGVILGMNLFLSSLVIDLLRCPKIYRLCRILRSPFKWKRKDAKKKEITKKEH